MDSNTIATFTNVVISFGTMVGLIVIFTVAFCAWDKWRRKRAMKALEDAWANDPLNNR